MGLLWIRWWLARLGGRCCAVVDDRRAVLNDFHWPLAFRSKCDKWCDMWTLIVQKQRDTGRRPGGSTESNSCMLDASPLRANEALTSVSRKSSFSFSWTCFSLLWPQRKGIVSSSSCHKYDSFGRSSNFNINWNNGQGRTGFDCASGPCGLAGAEQSSRGGPCSCIGILTSTTFDEKNPFGSLQSIIICSTAECSDCFQSLVE